MLARKKRQFYFCPFLKALLSYSCSAVLLPVKCCLNRSFSMNSWLASLDCLLTSHVILFSTALPISSAKIYPHGLNKCSLIDETDWIGQNRSRPSFVLLQQQRFDVSGPFRPMPSLSKSGPTRKSSERRKRILSYEKNIVSIVLKDP